MLAATGVCVLGQEFPKAAIAASHVTTLIDDGHDLIFPSLIRVTDHFNQPLAKYYLYTSPHGGADIRLYLADTIAGPWRLHGTVVDAETGRAPHVSSPHAVWDMESDQLLLYVHAPNAQTVYCTSRDGVNFEYGGVCVTRDMISRKIDFQSRSASYARVFRHRIPEYQNEWTMTLTASGKNSNKTVDRCAIVLCTSDDGMKWTVRRTLLDDGNGG